MELMLMVVCFSIKCFEFDFSIQQVFPYINTDSLIVHIGILTYVQKCVAFSFSDFSLSVVMQYNIYSKLVMSPPSPHSRDLEL
jgi:hypothetical protein